MVPPDVTADNIASLTESLSADVPVQASSFVYGPRWCKIRLNFGIVQEMPTDIESFSLPISEPEHVTKIWSSAKRDSPTNSDGSANLITVRLNRRLLSQNGVENDAS